MGQNQLDTIIKMATELKAKMGENEKEIPAWIQDHISKAENYISQAAGNYHEYGTNESVTESKFNAFFGNKKIDIDAKDLWDAKQKAILQLKVPKSKIGLLAVVSAESQKNQDFRFEIVSEDSPCWKGYKQVGMKDKGGRQVPNCVPNESVVKEATYNFGKEEYTKKNLTPTQIQDLAFGYVQTPITKLVGKTLGHRVNLANDLARLTGTKQLDAKARGKEAALIMVLLKNKLVSKEEYIQMYKDLIEKHQQVIKYLRNASPEMRNSGGAARAAAKDMKGEFDMD
jgi:hypothetical protein